jgi:hypothetical protein
LVKSIGLATGTTSARFTALSGKPAGNYVVQLLVNGVVVTSVPVSKT